MTEVEHVASCENVHKTYLLGIEGVAALRGVSVDVMRGELLVIYGTSGGGKSTLLNVLGTIDVPTKGNLALFNTRITEQTTDAELARLRCKHVGFVFQSFNLLTTMTAEDNVALPMIIAGERSASEIKERARQLLTDVGLAHRFQHYPSQLSGGEQQRVTIARALANDPEVLMLDEPTGDLDTKNTHVVLDILMRLNRERKLTMIMVTHDVYMKQYAHRVMYLRDGKVHNIETIDAAVREGAVGELREEMARLISGERADDSASQSGNFQTAMRGAQAYPTSGAQADFATVATLNRALCQKLFKLHEAMDSAVQR